MPRTRAELLRLHLLHKAAAAAFEAALKDRAASIFNTEGSADTWRLPLGLVTTNVNQAKAVVADEEAFLDYLEEHTAAVTRREIREVPAAFRERFLEGLTVYLNEQDEDEVKRSGRPGEMFDVYDSQTGAVVPGVKFTTGGTLASVSIRPDSDVKREANLSMWDYVSGEAEQPF
jgi:hypothetical protein